MFRIIVEALRVRDGPSCGGPIFSMMTLIISVLMLAASVWALMAIAYERECSMCYGEGFVELDKNSFIKCCVCSGKGKL